MKKIYNLNQYTKSNRNNTLDKLIKNKNLYFQLEQEDKYNYEIIKIYLYYSLMIKNS